MYKVHFVITIIHQNSTRQIDNPIAKIYGYNSAIVGHSSEWHKCNFSMLKNIVLANKNKKINKKQNTIYVMQGKMVPLKEAIVLHD